MTKPIIGIISPYTEENDRPFFSQIKFVNNYSKRIVEAGGIPIGILFPDGEFHEELLNLCDAFLFTGGSKISSAQVNAVHYARIHSKPVLGICLGFQTFLAYNWVKCNLKDLNYDIIKEIYKIEEENEEADFLERINGHDKLDPFYLSRIEESKHDIKLNKDSILYKIYQKETISVPSIHNWGITEFNNNDLFKATGKSLDGVIESIESVDSNWFSLGVQFHPELEDENLILFKYFIDSVKFSNAYLSKFDKTSQMVYNTSTFLKETMGDKK